MRQRATEHQRFVLSELAPLFYVIKITVLALVSRGTFGVSDSTKLAALTAHVVNLPVWNVTVRRLRHWQTRDLSNTGAKIRLPWRLLMPVPRLTSLEGNKRSKI